MVHNNDIKVNALLSGSLWRRIIAIVTITSIIGFAPALILTPTIFSTVHAQEYSPVMKWGKYGTTDGGFKSPTGIAVDSSAGKVYVADTANNRIQVFSSNGTFITKWGKYGLADGNLVSPTGIAVDSSAGKVYVADTANNRIQVFSSPVS